MRWLSFKCVLVFLSINCVAVSQTDNSNWQFVGPISNNFNDCDKSVTNLRNQDCNRFETGRVNVINVDPNNADRMLACGDNAGIYFSSNAGVNWDIIDTRRIEFAGNVVKKFNGVSTAVFNDDGKIILCSSDRTQADNIYTFFTDGIYEFEPSTNNWVLLNNPIENHAQNPYVYKVAVDPNDSRIIYLCSSSGLFRSIDGGGSWTTVVSDEYNIRDIEFIDLGTGVSDVIISGTKILDLSISDLQRKKFEGKTALLLSTNNGVTFSEVNGFKDFLANNNLAQVSTEEASMEFCKAYINDVPNLFFVLVGNTGAANIDYSTAKATYDVNSKGFNFTFFKNDNEYIKFMSAYRLGIEYDKINNVIWYGGSKLRRRNCFGSYNVNPYFSTTSILPNTTKVHYDLHDVIIRNNGSNGEIWVATDGGINKQEIAINNLQFEPMNNGLNISQVVGFSGSQVDPNRYMIGSHDIVQTNFFDGRIDDNNNLNFHAKYSHRTHENEGGIINSLNPNTVILDYSEYVDEKGYFVSQDGGETIGPRENDVIEESKFGKSSYFQDVERGRMYYGLKKERIMEFKNGEFVTKFDLWGCSYLNTSYQCGFNGMAFSQDDPNKVYLCTNGKPNHDMFSGVYKYIGGDFDGLNPSNQWYNGNDPQWQEISPDWVNKTNLNAGLAASFSAYTFPITYHFISYDNIETSILNDDHVYMNVNYGFKGEMEDMKVIKFNGSTWENYSSGIPAREVVTAMEMDPKSNDGLYLATNRSVYYRDASMSQWIEFGNNYPVCWADEMEINYNERTLRSGTFGRGVWKTHLKCPDGGTLNESGQYNGKVIKEGDVINSEANLKGNRVVYKASDAIVLKDGFYTGAALSVQSFFIQSCDSDVEFRAGSFVITKSSKEEEEQSVATIYPNPSSGLINLEVDFKISKVEIYNLTGHLVKTENTKDEFKISIDLSELQTGSYFIKVSNFERTYSEKVILTK